MNQVVITGFGCVSPIGNNREEFGKHLWAGACGGAPITKFDTTQFPVKYAFEVRNYAPSPSFKLLDPFIQYGLTATEEALAHSKLDVKQMDPYRIGVAVSSSKGGMTTLEKFRDRFLKRPSALLGARIYANAIPNMLSQWIARRLKLNGPAKCSVAACATGIYSIIEGIRMLEDDEADVCIAGASDASITPLMLAGYHQMGVLSKDTVRPFDRNRSGFLIGEGAGVVILEKESHAQARRATIHAHVLAHAYGFEIRDTIAFPTDGDGLRLCLDRLLRSAKIAPYKIDSLELHGTATQGGDLYETAQLKLAFGKDAYKISTSAIKSMIGHTVGASGALSVIACLLSLRDQVVPPTIHLEKPDPACDLDYTPNRAKQKKVSIAGAIAMGFGGHIGAILFGK